MLLETFANVPVVMQMGAEAYASIGTDTPKGTKTFALTGHVTYTGLIEVPFGTTLRQIIGDIGGGMLNDDGTNCGLDFREEYNAHVFEGRCPANQCEAFKKYIIIEEKCKSCGLCARKCPVNAIEGAKGVPYTIERTFESTFFVLCDGIGSGVYANIAAITCANRMRNSIDPGFPCGL
jgi:ferredoxin